MPTNHNVEFLTNELSEATQEMIGRVPGQLTTAGTIVLSLICLMCIVATCVIKFPNKLEGKLTFISKHTPKELKSKTEGRLINLLVKEQDEVKTNEVLAWVECVANHDEVMKLNIELQQLQQDLKKGNVNKIKSFGNNKYTKLGEVQSVYNEFEQEYILMISSIDNNFYVKKRNFLDQEMQDLKHNEENLNQQLLDAQRDYAISAKSFEAQQQLAKDGVITNIQMEEEESKLISKSQSIKQLQSSLIGNAMIQKSKRQELMDLEHTLLIQQKSFYQAMNKLSGEIEAWKLNYLLVAPEGGIVHFSSLIVENQLLKQGQLIMSILPEGNEFFGEILIPQNSLGKIKKGQIVQVRIDGYPYNEFGLIRGKVDFIANLPNEEGNFFIKVVFENTDKTSYGKSISLKNGMTASAEIVTEDLLLMERLFMQLRGATATQ